VARLLPGTDPVHKVSIIPRGRALGVTMQLPGEDRHGYSKTFLQNNMAVLLAGRVAEEIVLGQVTTGAGNDIERATKTARKMVCEWGMSEKLGPISMTEGEGEVFLGRDMMSHKNYSEETAQIIDAEIKRIVTQGHSKAKELLEENLDTLHRLAAALLERETLTGKEVDLIMEGKELASPEILAKATKGDAAGKQSDDEDFSLEEGES
jgi:cell division protease FtsH